MRMFSKEPGGRTGYIYRSSRFPHALIAIPYFPAFPTTGWLIHNPHFSPLSASDFLLQHRRARVCRRRRPLLTTSGDFLLPHRSSPPTPQQLHSAQAVRQYSETTSMLPPLPNLCAGGVSRLQPDVSTPAFFSVFLWISSSAPPPGFEKEDIALPVLSNDDGRRGHH